MLFTQQTVRKREVKRGKKQSAVVFFFWGGGRAPQNATTTTVVIIIWPSDISADVTRDKDGRTPCVTRKSVGRFHAKKRSGAGEVCEML